MESNGIGTVVVGIDGSPGSRAALEFALDEAARRQARLRVVAAARMPEHWATAYGMPQPPAPSQIIADVKAEAQRMVDAVIGGRPQSGVSITVEAQAGAPGDVLAQASQGADLLVIGHRGRGRVVSALIGSVGLDCMLHATCPVTVVPATQAHTEVPAAAGAVPAQA
jgi:nucleotide-binding universal stress UspA family protein